MSGKPKTENCKRLLSEMWSGDAMKGERNPNYGHKWSDEMKRKMSEMKRGMYVGDKNPNYGKRWSTAQREHLSRLVLERNKIKPNPMSGMKRITDGKVNKVIKEGEALPPGFRFGMAPRKKS